jgi:Restriction endonuclease
MKRKTSPTLDFKEISNEDVFENLVAAYFRTLTKSGKIVKVKQTGKGIDRGKDILVLFRVDDGITEFERLWVIQCKFYENTLYRSELSDINIPTLIHQSGAVGYLLVCKKNVSSGVEDMFSELNANCKFHYHYLIWNGDIFKSKLYPKPSILKQFFPKYYASINKLRNKGKK